MEEDVFDAGNLICLSVHESGKKNKGGEQGYARCPVSNESSQSTEDN